MAFDTDEVTVYQVRPRHRHQEVQEVVPVSYQGVMVTDRGRSYEAHSFSWVKQQKCLAHLQKTLSVLLEQKKGRARQLGENLKMLFGMALDLCGRSTTLGRQRTLQPGRRSCALPSATSYGSGDCGTRTTSIC
jgi:hypothetical protein